MTFCQAKYLSLVLLVVQNSCSVLLARYSRTRPGTLYLGSTAVCCDEAIKLVTCLGILTIEYILKKRNKSGDDGRYSQLSTSEAPDDSSIGSTGGDSGEGANGENNRGSSEPNNDSESFRSYLIKELQFDIRVVGIAGLFTIQNNLLFAAISNLDAAVYQITYQTRILTTAVFSVVLLGRKLSYKKIGALAILAAGMAISQLDNAGEKLSKSNQEQKRWLGVLAILGASCTSGFAAVYFELVLKPRQDGADGTSPPRPIPSVWAKNVQLSASSLVIALVAAFIKDHKIILADGFFRGYTPLVWLVIVFKAAGGLLRAMVIKYADNILKLFANAASIVILTIVSIWLFGFIISPSFVGGCLLVFVAIGLYSIKDTAVSSESLAHSPDDATDNTNSTKAEEETEEETDEEVVEGYTLMRGPVPIS